MNDNATSIAPVPALAAEVTNLVSRALSPLLVEHFGQPEQATGRQRRFAAELLTRVAVLVQRNVEGNAQRAYEVARAQDVEALRALLAGISPALVDQAGERRGVEMALRALTERGVGR